MSKDISAEILKNLTRKDGLREHYVRRAFSILPGLNDPRILDIGCGTGISTIELARLSGGQIIAVDIDQSALDELTERVKRLDLIDRVHPMNRSLFSLDFEDVQFDIVWSEGSIFIIGFERGLNAWRRLLKTDGFLVVHEMIWLREDPPEEILEYWKKRYPAITSSEKLVRLIRKCGYRLVGHFPLPEDSWWHEYYSPLEQRIVEFEKKYRDDPHALADLNRHKYEIELYKKYNRWYGSAFFVMQKGPT